LDDASQQWLPLLLLEFLLLLLGLVLSVVLLSVLGVAIATTAVVSAPFLRGLNSAGAAGAA
jgi:hypothetical protein